MNLQALKYVVRPQRGGPTLGELDVAGLATIKATHLEELPFAYVVRNDDLSRLRDLGDSIVDRGTKNKAKGLSAVLFGQNRIPVIRGSYRSSRQLTRSVRALLANALERDRNVYVVGVDAAVFEELLGRVEAAPPAEPQGAPTAISRLYGLLPHEPVPEDILKAYLGGATEVRLVHQLILRAARQSDPVLVLGESGTGKELVARAIYRHSSRSEKPFIPVNCAGIPGELLESELFGHKKGAFTGAYYDKEGLWQAADKGTLFLDEIGDLSLDHQVKVLRALEDGRIRKVGSEEEKKVDARIIAATNRDLPAMLRAGSFREELYYRLCGLQIYTPALREHPEDIPLLAEHFWKKIAGPQADPLPADILAELKHYPWPGNARLLRWVLVHLDRLFGRDAPRIEHLMAVLYYLGLAAPPP